MSTTSTSNSLLPFITPEVGDYPTNSVSVTNLTSFPYTLADNPQAPPTFAQAFLNFWGKLQDSTFYITKGNCGVVTTFNSKFIADFERSKIYTNLTPSALNILSLGEGVGGLALIAAVGLADERFLSLWQELTSKMKNREGVTTDLMQEFTPKIAKVLYDVMDQTSWEFESIDNSPIHQSGEDHQAIDTLLYGDLTKIKPRFKLVPPSVESYGSVFQGPQIDHLKSFIFRKKHVVLLGPPGTGKTLAAMEALSLTGYPVAGEDYQIFSAHEEVRTSDFLGAWQPDGKGGFDFVPGVLVRAMQANDGKGCPLLVEEFTRMPRRSQNIFISALSDGYITLNEKHSGDGTPEIVRAGPDFVFIADMNVDPMSDDIELFGGAFASRVRKIEFGHPDRTTMSFILLHKFPEIEHRLNDALVTAYDLIMKKFIAGEFTTPVSPRGIIFWMEDLLDSIRDINDVSALRIKAKKTAEMTWLRDVAGNNQNLRRELLSLVDSIFRKVFTNGSV